MADWVERFFRAYYTAPMRTVYAAGQFPDEMRAGPVDEDGWVAWKLVEPTHTNDYSALESEFGVSVPGDFKEWHSRFYFLDGDCGDVRFPAAPSNDPLGGLYETWHAYGDVLESGLLPLAEDGNDGGPLVADLRGVTAAETAPIRFLDHELLSEPDHLGPVVASSFRKLVELVTYTLTHSEPTTAAEVQQFLAIDPSARIDAGSPVWRAWVTVWEGR